ncbi:hypothetical protein F383_26235 [Gossypium arboreum]|nr:hypothetical protein F383_26235 [Gossypium arboreum]
MSGTLASLIDFV